MYVQSSLVPNAWGNQMNIKITSLPDHMFLPTCWACSLISSIRDVAATLNEQYCVMNLFFKLYSVLPFIRSPWSNRMSKLKGHSWTFPPSRNDSQYHRLILDEICCDELILKVSSVLPFIHSFTLVVCQSWKVKCSLVEIVQLRETYF